MPASEDLEHPGVAERVRLDVREVEELRDALVGAADELRVDVGIDDLLADRREAAPREEVDLEGEAEQAREPERAGADLEAFDDRAADAVVQPVVRDDQRADLAEVLPHHVQGAAADQPAVLVLGDEELLHRLVEHDEVLAEQDPPLHERLEQRLDAAHVRASRRTHRELTHASSLGSRPETDEGQDAGILPFVTAVGQWLLAVTVSCRGASAGPAQSSGSGPAETIGAATVVEEQSNVQVRLTVDVVLSGRM